MILSDEEEQELIRLTKDLITIPSSMTDGKEIYDKVTRYLEDNSIDVQNQTVSSPYVDNDLHRNLYARIGDGKGPRIMLNCHLDTVQAGSGWFFPPYSAHEEDGKIYGLGAADMKAGCAIAIITFLAIARRKEVRGELFLSCVFGEEAPFSLGTDALLREHDLKGYDLIIVPEPSPLLAINDYCVRHKRIHKANFPVVIIGAEGRIMLEIEFFGRPSHASHPSQGINALHDAAKVITGLENLDVMSNIKMGRGHYVVLNIEGGDQTFTVPPYCKLMVNRQLTLGESERTVMKEINRLISSLGIRSKVRIRKRFSPAPELEYRPYICEKGRYLESFMKHVSSSCPFTTSSVGDFNLFGTRTKVPVLVFGPGGGRIHAPNEYVNRDEIVSVARTLLEFLLDVFEVSADRSE